MSTGSRGDIQIENEHFRVTRWTVEPGGSIPMHRHDFEYVVVPLVNARMHVENSDGTELVAELTVGESYTRAAGAEHTISNRESDDDIVFVEVERL